MSRCGHLDAAFRALIQRIKTRYTLGYYTKATGAEGKPHKLDVRLTSSFGKKGHDYVVLAKAAITSLKSAEQSSREEISKRMATYRNQHFGC